MPTRQGSIRLFRFSGIDVYLHWSWFIFLPLMLLSRKAEYSSLAWNAAEYLALFAIVLMHEFGHSLACRQVGGKADQIVLWPLGGVAYVAPPQRPGATLWSIAAGPLVNLVLLPLAILLKELGGALGWHNSLPNLQRFLEALALINGALLVFNLLPIYPLDGGQILRALLWFFLGRGRSLMVATVVGFAGVAGLVGLAILPVFQSPYLAIMAAFIFLNCWRGLLHARQLSRIEKAPRREGFACPACHAKPPIGAFWGCGRCRARFDTFESGAICPACSAGFDATTCAECGVARPFSEWVQPPTLPPPLPSPLPPPLPPGSGPPPLV